MTQDEPSAETGQRHLKVFAGIPCYNEAHFIRDVVLKTKKFVDLVIVVDDGSIDATADIAEAAGALVVRHETNRGNGEAVKSYLKAAKANGFDILVTLDGDGQHDPDDVPQVIHPLLTDEADFVIGSRFLEHKNTIPKYRRFGIYVITLLTNFGASVKVSDAQSGFRAFNRNLLDSISLTESGMGISVEVIIEARRKGFVIKEVPISCVYHSRGSKLNPVTHGLGVALAVVRLRLKSTLGRLVPKLGY